MSIVRDYSEAERILLTPMSGEVIMWPFNVPPEGFLICDGSSYAYDTYPALGALFGAVSGGNFNVPDIDFAKNSKGVDTNTSESASVGTHGHTADAVAAHGHTVSVVAVGNHTHTTSAGGNTKISSGSYTAANDVAGTATSAAGAHGHSASAGSGGAHTPTIQDHIGTNQPACTLINFCIRT